MVPIFATWVNVHGSWIYGLAVLGLFAACEAVDDPPRRPAAVGRCRHGRARGGRGGPAVPGADGPGPAAAGPVRRRPGPPGPVGLPGMGARGLGPPVDLGARGHGRGRPRTAPCAGARWCRGWGWWSWWPWGSSAGRLMPIAAISVVGLAAQGLDGVGTLRCPIGRSARAGPGSGSGAAGRARWRGRWWAPATTWTRYPVDAVDWLDERGLVARPDVRVASHDYVRQLPGVALRSPRPTPSWTTGPGQRHRPGLPARSCALETAGRTALARADPDMVVWCATAAADQRARPTTTGWYEAMPADGFTVFCRSPHRRPLSLSRGSAVRRAPVPPPAVRPGPCSGGRVAGVGPPPGGPPVRRTSRRPARRSSAPGAPRSGVRPRPRPARSGAPTLHDRPAGPGHGGTPGQHPAGAVQVDRAPPARRSGRPGRRRRPCGAGPTRRGCVRPRGR